MTFIPKLPLLLLLLPAFSAPSAAASSRPDIVLITIDTLRADALGFAGNRRVQTPNLDRLATTGRFFTSAHAHNVVTLPSHANLLTGLYPFQHGVRENSGFLLPPAVPTLATILQAAGYKTGAFVSGFPLESRFGLARGFDVYDDRFSSALRGEEFGLPERRGDDTVKAAIAWWNTATGAPRFLWLHLFDPHAPYAAPEPWASKYRNEPYLGEVAAVDAYLAPLLEPLLAGRGRPTLLALTADHGESLGEHGESTHGLFVYEATLKVPLVLWGKGVEPGRDERPVRHIDVFPTLLEGAGLTAPPVPGIASRPGRSLLALGKDAEPTETYFEALSAALNRGWAPLRGLLRDGRKWIELPLPELYDLPSDPAESRNLVDEERRAARALAAAMPAASAWPPARGEVRGEDIAQLAALGYVADNAPLRTRFGPEDDPKNLLALDQQILATIDAYSRGKLPEALTLARKIVAARPSMSLGRSLLAQTLLESGQQQEALEVMRRAKADGVASDTLLRQLGLTLAENGKTAEARELLEPLAAAGDRDARAHLALALSEAGDQTAAAAEVAVLLAADSGDTRALELSSLVALRRGRFEEARQAASKTIELAPGRARAHNNLGVALFSLGRKAEGVDAWQKAVDLDERLFDAWWNLGVQAKKLGRSEQARRALTVFATKAPRARYAADIDEARRLLAELAEKGGS